MERWVGKTVTAGKAFSAGVDLKFLESETPPGEEVGVRLNHVVREVLQSTEALPKPIIAVVSGFCLTGGLEIALDYDLIIASDNAKATADRRSLAIKC